ncbi:MAG: glycosyl hydrolase family 8 [Parcubacteria group bacterium]|jgi:endoglucanase
MEKIYHILIVISLLFVVLFFFMGNEKEKEVPIEDNVIVIENEKLQESVVNDSVSILRNNIYTEIKSRFNNVDGRFIGEKNRVVSESQSYMMLIAVLSDDRKTFDKTWNWTKNNLQVRKNDKLFSWLWKNGKVSDTNSATDADQDIAYALYLANKKWGEGLYLDDARKIISDIWKVETKEIKGVRYIGAGNWAVNDASGIIINPSYFAPYQYRVFAQIDPVHDWISLVDSSYKALNHCTSATGLAQDWCKIDNSGKVIKNFKMDKKDNSVYSYDALRVPYRIAMDYYSSNDMRALEYLKKNKIFIEDWGKNKKIFAVYNQKGEHAGKNESLASYGTQLASMSLINKEIAQEILDKKIKTIEFWEKVSFYDLSWIWFGLYFYEENK